MLNAFVDQFLLAAGLSKAEEVGTHKANGWILRRRTAHDAHLVPILLEYFVILTGKGEQVWPIIHISELKKVLVFKSTVRINGYGKFVEPGPGEG